MAAIEMNPQAILDALFAEDAPSNARIDDTFCCGARMTQTDSTQLECAQCRTVRRVDYDITKASEEMRVTNQRLMVSGGTVPQQRFLDSLQPGSTKNLDAEVHALTNELLGYNANVVNRGLASFPREILEQVAAGYVELQNHEKCDTKTVRSTNKRKILAAMVEAQCAVTGTRRSKKECADLLALPANSFSSGKTHLYKGESQTGLDLGVNKFSGDKIVEGFVQRLNIGNIPGIANIVTAAVELSKLLHEKRIAHTTQTDNRLAGSLYLVMNLPNLAGENPAFSVSLSDFSSRLEIGGATIKSFCEDVQDHSKKIVDFLTQHNLASLRSHPVVEKKKKATKKDAKKDAKKAAK
jgi:hypothetical protein